jgi:hypothetical protein
MRQAEVRAVALGAGTASLSRVPTDCWLEATAIATTPQISAGPRRSLLATTARSSPTSARPHRLFAVQGGPHDPVRRYAHDDHRDRRRLGRIVPLRGALVCQIDTFCQPVAASDDTDVFLGVREQDVGWHGRGGFCDDEQYDRNSWNLSSHLESRCFLEEIGRSLTYGVGVPCPIEPSVTRDRSRPTGSEVLNGRGD